jgi:hypothetical protein
MVAFVAHVAILCGLWTCFVGLETSLGQQLTLSMAATSKLRRCCPDRSTLDEAQGSAQGLDSAIGNETGPQPSELPDAEILFAHPL